MFQINEMIQENFSLRCIATKQITSHRFQIHCHADQDGIERNQQREVTYTRVAQCDFKSWFFFIFIIILDISLSLLPHTAFLLFFCNSAMKKRLNAAKKHSRRRSFTVGLYFWCVCFLPDIFLRLKKHSSKYVYGQGFLISILLLETLDVGGIVYK